ncbi:MAG: hypothetical protein ACREJM_04745 [Candidatus Saccharimonadales bacterium]
MEIVAETVTMSRAENVLFDNSDCCEDCPDVNPDPPSDSEGPYFDVRNGKPMCTRPTGLERMMGGGGAGTGVEDFGKPACKQLIERVEE